MFGKGPWCNPASHWAGIVLVPFSPVHHRGDIPVTLWCRAAWRQVAGLGAKGRVSVRAGLMFEGLLVLDVVFAQVTAVWVCDIRTSTCGGELEGSRCFVLMHHTLLLRVQTSVGAASLVRC